MSSTTSNKQCCRNQDKKPARLLSSWIPEVGFKGSAFSEPGAFQRELDTCVWDTRNILSVMEDSVFSSKQRSSTIPELRGRTRRRPCCGPARRLPHETISGIPRKKHKCLYMCIYTHVFVCMTFMHFCTCILNADIVCIYIYIHTHLFVYWYLLICIQLYVIIHQRSRS